MSEANEEYRSTRLSAILAADIAGYTRLVERDTQGTVQAWRSARSQVIDPTIDRHRGRIVKHTGDGFLAEFGSAQDAVRCAIVLQQGLRAGPLEFRMGVSLGDIVDDGEDIHGEGVNLAARIEALAEPRTINVTATVYEAVRNRVDTTFHDLGEHMVKHVSAPVRVYRIALEDAPGQDAAPAPEPQVRDAPRTALPLPLPDKPSIAVLPFDNLSADPEQEYFADGIVEDIITELSRSKWLFVIARNSSFTYKGSAVDVTRVGRELGVGYVLEGSVRKAANRVRITAQLIDATTGSHLWAERFDGELSDIFDLQDQVTQSVVGALAPRLELAEIERTKRKPTDSLHAYDLYLRGMAAFHRFDREENRQALAMFTAAFERDPEFASAFAMAARCYAQRKGFGWIVHPEQENAEALGLARTAAAKGPDDAIALAAAGFTMVLFGNVGDGDALVERALVLNPNLAWAWHISGFAKALAGYPDQVVERAERAMRLSPQDPQRFAMQGVIALGHLLCGDHDQAGSWSESALRDRPNFLLAAGVAAVAAAVGGRTALAGRAMERLREGNPALRASNLNEWLEFRRQEDAERWAQGLRMAGLPE